MAAKTWAAGTGAGSDNLWSTAANWTSNTVPAAGDTVTIDGTASSPNLTVDAIGTFNGSITVTSAYAGIVTQNVDITAGAAAAFSIAGGTWNQAAAFTCTTMGVTGGTWTGASQAMNLTGTLTFSGGTLTMTSGTCTINTGSFTQSGTVTFAANGGTIHFTGTGSHALTGPNCTFSKISFNRTAILTITAGTTAPLGTDPSNTLTNAVFTVNGTVTWTGTFTMGDSTELLTGASATITVSGTPVLVANNDVNINATTTLTSGIALTWTGSATAVLTSTGYTFGSVSINRTGVTTIAASTTVALGSNPTINTGSAALNVNGTMTATGTVISSSSGLFTVGSGGTLSGMTTLQLTRSFTVSATGTVPTGLILDIRHNGATTITATTASFGACLVDSPGTAALTIATGTTLPLGANPSTDIGGSGANFTVNGTVTWTGTWTSQGNIVVASDGTLSGGTQVTLTASTWDCNVNGNIPAGLNVRVNLPAATVVSFSGGGKTYGWLYIDKSTASSTGIYTISDSNTFTYIQCNAGQAAHQLRFTESTTTTLTDANPFRVAGVSGKNITLRSVSTTVKHIITATNPSAQIRSTDFMTINDSQVDASPIWYAGANSTDGADNTNWVFTAPPPLARKSIFIM